MAFGEAACRIVSLTHIQSRTRTQTSRLSPVSDAQLRMNIEPNPRGFGANLQPLARVRRGLAARCKTHAGGERRFHLLGRGHQVLGQRAAPIVCHGKARAGWVRLVALQRALAAQTPLEPPPVQPLDSADPVPTIRRRPGGPQFDSFDRATNNLNPILMPGIMMSDRIHLARPDGLGIRPNSGPNSPSDGVLSESLPL